MRKLLYVFDDINYKSGARAAMLLQMENLMDDYQIHIFSLAEPQDVSLPKGSRVIGEGIWRDAALFSDSLRDVWRNRAVGIGSKLLRTMSSVGRRLGKKDNRLQRLVGRRMGRELEEYDVVIVVSEASKLREAVAGLKHPKKIQWIHTDYALWSGFSDWTRAITRKDGELYLKFDHIAVLSEHSRDGMLRKIPALRGKLVTVPNLIDGDRILRRAEEECGIRPEHGKCNLITVGRLEKEKAYDRVLDICARLLREGKAFCWHIVGEGSLRGHLERRIAAERLGECVKLLGEMENPYPLMKKCDCFVLLSEYEGTPVTVDEAMVLGVPVIARDVGGIREQLERGGCGVLVRTEDEAVSAIRGGRQTCWQGKHFSCTDSNAETLKKLRVLFGRGD